MGLKLDHLPPEVAACLRAYYRRKQTLRLLRILLSIAVVYALLVLAATHLDRFMFLETGTRVLMLWLVHAAVLVFAVVRIAVFLAWRPTARAIAYELESKLPPNVEERYVTLENVLERGGYERDKLAEHFVQHLTDATVEHSRAVRAARLVRDRMLRKLAWVLAAVGLVYVLLVLPAGYEFGLMLQRFYMPRAPLAKASFVKISVKPETLVIGKGGEAVIQAEVRGSVPAPLMWIMTKLGAFSPRCVISLSQKDAKAFSFAEGNKCEMNRIHRSLFLLARGNLQQSFAFQVRYGDGQTGIHVVRVVAQPRIVSVTLKVRPPEYTGLPEETIENAQAASALRFLPQSEVKLLFRTDQPVQTATIGFEGRDDTAKPLWDEATLTGTYDMTLKQKTTLEILAVNKEGFANVERARVTIDLREDMAPSVRLELPTGELEKVPGELVPVQAQAEDDLGIDEAAIQFTVNPDQNTESVPKEIPIPLQERKQKNVRLAAMFDLGEAGVVPGDIVVARVRVRDCGGNDGFSGQVVVRVVPFTRGENERRRLVALGFTRDALNRIASFKPDRPGAVGPFSVDADLYRQISETAAKLDVGLEPTPSVESLLGLLEREHHFTDLPRHKEDVRKLRAVILYACTPFAAGSVADREAFRAARLKDAADVAAALTGLRRLKNITWRLFGMRYEARRIAATLAELAARRRPDPDLERSATRRAELYLKTLQDIGDDLIQLSRQTGALNEEKVKQVIGELNTSAYYVKTGALPARCVSCEKVQELISVTMAMNRSAFVPLLQEELAARARLDAMYDACIERAARASPQEASDVARWLQADSRLMSMNPFQPLWPQLVNLNLRKSPPEARAGELLKPPAAVEGAVRQERLAEEALALQWEAASVLALGDISNLEKALELRLITLERAARVGPVPDDVLTRARTDLAVMDMASDVGDTQLAALAEKCLGSPGADMQAALANRAANIYGIAAFVAQRSLLPSPEQELRALLQDIERNDAAIARTLEALRAGDSEFLKGNVTALPPLLVGELERLRSAAESLFLQLSLLGHGGQVEAQELLLLKLRETAERHNARLASAMRSLEVFQPTAQDLTGLSGDLEQLKFLRQTLKTGVEKLLSDYAQAAPPKDEETEKYALLREFRRTERMLATAITTLEGKADAATVGDFLEAFPEAGLFHLNAHENLVASSARLLDKAEARLKQAPPDAKGFAASALEGRRLLAEFRAVVEQAGPGEHQTRISAKLAQLMARMERLVPAEGPRDTTEVNRALYSLAEIRKLLAALRDDLETVAEQTRPEETGFGGAPAAARAEVYRHQAEKARERLLGQVRYARQSVFEGVLESLREKPGRQVQEEGVAWAVFLHRLVRSDLCGVGGIRPPGAGKEREADPHLQFLQTELAKALQVKNLKNYAEPTKEYLESVRDFLRY